MRALLALALMLPCPALAETIAATSRITAVTLYPSGAEVTRTVTFMAPAGAHEVLITDLPATTEPALLRIRPGGDLQTGAFALRDDRLPATPDVKSAAQTEAEARIEVAEADLRRARAAASAVQARIEAAEAQAGFLRGIGGQMPDAATPDAMQAMARMIGAEVLAARQAVLAAEADLVPAQEAVADAEKRLGDAQADLAALASTAESKATLSVAITAPAAGAAELTVTHFIADARWTPVYDMDLVRQGMPSLAIARGVLVTQTSGEDWAGVDLTLSTATPSDQSAPSTLWPEPRRIVSKDESRAKAGAVAPEMALDMAEPVMEPEVVAAAPDLVGDVVVYRYPAPVDVASGVEDLRLALDTLTFAPDVRATAVPRADRTAFVTATFTNTTPEILLPGEAFLSRDGVLVGSLWLDTLAPGAEAELAFGPVEALRLTRDLPIRAEGDRGILSKSSRIAESAVLKVENLGTETWPVRMMDLVPYSEQEDLEITFTADPAPDETDVKGQRGILAWDFELAPGETREVRLDSLLEWPDGMVLQ